MYSLGADLGRGGKIAAATAVTWLHQCHRESWKLQLALCLPLPWLPVAFLSFCPWLTCENSRNCHSALGNIIEYRELQRMLLFWYMNRMWQPGCHTIPWSNESVRKISFESREETSISSSWTEGPKENGAELLLSLHVAFRSKQDMGPQ